MLLAEAADMMRRLGVARPRSVPCRGAGDSLAPVGWGRGCRSDDALQRHSAALAAGSAPGSLLAVMALLGGPADLEVPWSLPCRDGGAPSPAGERRRHMHWIIAAFFTYQAPWGSFGSRKVVARTSRVILFQAFGWRLLALRLCGVPCWAQNDRCGVARPGRPPSPALVAVIRSARTAGGRALGEPLARPG